MRNPTLSFASSFIFLFFLVFLSGKGFGQSDNMPPILEGFSISEYCIDTSNDTIDVVFTSELSDDLSGVESVFLIYLTPNGLQSSEEMSLISGDSLLGTYELTVAYDNLDIDGVYIYGLYAIDHFNNSLSLSVYSREIQSAGYQDSLKIINTNSDYESPELINFTISETCIDIGTSAVDVTFSAHLSDNMSGVDKVFMTYLTPSNLQSSYVMPLVSGDSLNGTYELTITYDSNDIDGVYTYGLITDDYFNNSLTYNVYNRELLSAGHQDSLKLINSLIDVDPPVLKDFQISETCIDVIDGTSNVTFTAELTDNLSGVDIVFLHYLTPNNLQSSYEMTLVSGDSLDGIYETTIPYSSANEAGVYVYGLSYDDNFDNSDLYNVYNRDLLNEGFVDSMDYLIPYLELIDNMLYFPDPNDGIIFENAVGGCYKVSVSNIGNLIHNSILCNQVDAKVTIEKGNAFISLIDSPIVMTAPNGGRWTIEIDNLGSIVTSQYSGSGVDQNIIHDGDLYLDRFPECSNNGITLKSPDNSCWILELNASNITHGRAVNCP